MRRPTPVCQIDSLFSWSWVRFRRRYLPNIAQERTRGLHIDPQKIMSAQVLDHTTLSEPDPTLRYQKIVVLRTRRAKKNIISIRAQHKYQRADRARPKLKHKEGREEERQPKRRVIVHSSRYNPEKQKPLSNPKTDPAAFLARSQIPLGLLPIPIPRTRGPPRLVSPTGCNMRSTTSPRVVTCQLANILVELGPTAVMKITSGAMPRSTSDRKTPWLLSTGVTDSSRWTLPAAFGWEGVERSEFMSSSVWKGR